MKFFPKHLLTAFLLTGIVVSCYDETAVMDKINGLDSRISALEQQMQTANSNISSLQTITAALQKNVSVTSVTEVEGGYKIIFSDGTTAIIKNGADGRTPSIGVKQDSDGVYYWTLDGNWLLDAKGNKVRVTGEDGKPGSDAVAPQLKIEKGFWYLSTDGGATWSQLGKATGEDGDAWFKDVKVDEDYVYLTLADGTVLKLLRSDGPIVSVAVIPDYNDGSVKAGAGLFTIRFNVEPASSAPSLLDLANDCFTLKAVYTLTKAEGDIITLPIHKREVEDGILTITTTGEDLAAEFASNKLGVNAALFISDEGFAVNSGYFQLWPRNEYMGHEYVDLGLESGNMWADGNLGSKDPSDPGNFYAWGETKPKDHYSWDNYIWCKGTEDTIFKYCDKDGARSYKDYNYEDDPIRAAWGGEWRTPTVEDWEELLDTDNYTWTWTQLNGTWGYSVSSKKKGYEGQSIFLPATGFIIDDVFHPTVVGAENHGFDPQYPNCIYWSSELWRVSYEDARILVAAKERYSTAWVCPRYCGLVASRPVLGKYEAKNVTGISIAPGSLTLAVGMIKQLTAKLVPEDADNPKVAWSSSNPGVATVSEDGTVTAVSIGTATVTVKSVDSGVSATCAVTVKDESELAPQAVDLGLPSGVKWATFNVGATSPEDYGDYFAWGETEPYYLPGHALDSPCNDWKSDKWRGYAWGSYIWSKGNTDEITKYNYNKADNAYSFKDYDYEDDPARVVWGGEWRTPTFADMTDLQRCCKWTPETVNNIFGCRVTSKINGNSIFLPAAGHRKNLDVYVLGTSGDYMTATLSWDDDYKDFGFWYGDDGLFYKYVGSECRYFGMPVRPVLGEEKEIPITGISLDQTEITLIPGQTFQLHATVEPETATYQEYIEWWRGYTDVAEVSRGLVTALKPGKCTVGVRAIFGGFEATCQVTVLAESEVEHEAVDLGLPSGVKWATVNLGASKPEDAGDYYAWGETEPYYQPGHAQDETCKDWRTGKEAGYDLKSYRWYDGTWTKYNIYSGYGKVDNKTSFKDYNYADDAARAKWAGEWRMPSKADWDELNDYCSWTWTEQTGVKGYLVSGSSGKSIFIPAAGNREYKDKVHPGEGYYYTSDLFVHSIANNPGFACRMQFDKNERTTKTASGRFCGLSIRPVLGEPAPPPEPDYVDMGLSVKWAKCNVGAKTETDFGDYFAWGETEPYYQDGYAYNSSPLWKPGKGSGYYWPSYRWCNGDYDSITKYDTDGIITLLPEDDAATANVGKDWRMPTKAEWEELMDKNNCYWDCTKVQGVPGYMVISYKTGNSIFLPSAGRRDEDRLSNPEDDGTIGYYWSSSLSDIPSQAKSLFFVDENDGGGIFIHDNDRCYGYSVRAICE